MADRTREIHVAIVAALKADSAVAALVSTRIYDRAPEGVTFPCVQVTAEIGSYFDGVELAGWEQVMRVDIWSRAGGGIGESYDIAEAISTVLHGTDQTLGAGKFINGRMIDGGQRIDRDADTETIHTMQRYRFVTQN